MPLAAIKQLERSLKSLTHNWQRHINFFALSIKAT